MSTKIKTSDGWKDVAGNTIAAEYIRNQNILSDYESVTIGTSAATATTMQYDGFITFNKGGITLSLIYKNGGRVAGANNVAGTAVSVTIPVCKGDTVYITSQQSSDLVFACFYKLRDYTGR